ncbi:MAG: hypothetical protein M0Z39_10475 [Actinomycetota bacterium]|nr:hypothetical protein [Actinomycetota bacterium]
MNELLDGIAAKGSFHIVKDLAEPVPQEVLARILRFDEEAKIKNRKFVFAVVHAHFGSSGGAWNDLRSFSREEIHKRQSEPGDDFFCHLC